MKHKVSKEVGVALDYAIKKYTVEGFLDEARRCTWDKECHPLNRLSMYYLAKYLIEGYVYPKTKEELFSEFTTWLQEYNAHVPYETKNSSYRKGRRHTLEEINKKMVELGIIDKRD